MVDYKLIRKEYVTLDLVAKVTGRAKYAEDFRAEGMLFTKLLLSPMLHDRVRSLDTSAAMAMPGVEAILTVLYVGWIFDFIPSADRTYCHVILPSNMREMPSRCFARYASRAWLLPTVSTPGTSVAPPANVPPRFDHE